MIDQDDDWESPHDRRTRSPRRFQQARYAHDSPKTSVMSIVSMVAGILSMPAICLCFTSIPMGLLAIACGHGARSVIRHSRGEYGGTEMATAGLMTGYFSLLITAGMLAMMTLSMAGSESVVIHTQPPHDVEKVEQKVDAQVEMGQQKLNAARQVLLDSVEGVEGVSTTETDALDLARHVQESLTELQVQMDTRQAVADGGPTKYHRVYARVTKGCVILLVDVQNLRRVDLPDSSGAGPADSIEGDACWVIASQSVNDIVPNGTKLSVAIYESNELTSVLSGTISDDVDLMAGLVSQHRDLALLAKEFAQAK